MVEESLYRSGQPNELNFPFLEKLGLKTVIWLAPGVFLLEQLGEILLKNAV